MGQQAPSIVQALSIDACAKYVCNACHVDSTCCDMCEFHVQTEKVDLPESEDEEYEFQVNGCCSMRKKEGRKEGDARGETSQDGTRPQGATAEATV